MKTFKVTYSDGTSCTTDANGTAAEFEAYLTQCGRTVCTYEDPETGKEYFKTIATVEEILDPAPGQTYIFTDYEDMTVPMIITKVTDTHVYYKFTERTNNIPFEYSYPMVIELWNENPDGRIYTGTLDDPDYLRFIENPHS